MSFTYRCGSCRRQRTFKKQLIDNKCPDCEKGNLHRFTRDKIRDKTRNCYCEAYPFKGAPHRTGTAPWCIHSKREPTREEYEERYGPISIVYVFSGHVGYYKGDTYPPSSLPIISPLALAESIPL